MVEPVFKGQRGKGKWGKSQGGGSGGRNFGPGVRLGQFSQQKRVADGELGANVGGYACGKVGASGGVKRNGQHPAQQAAVEGGDPLGAVFRPKQDAVALGDALLGQIRGKTAGEARQIAISVTWRRLPR